MKRAENLNAPSLSGWLLAAAAGFAAFLVSKVIGGFDWTPSVFFGLVVMIGSGLVMGMPWGASVPDADSDSGAADAAHGGQAAASVVATAPSASTAPVASSAAVSSAAVAAAPVVTASTAAAPAVVKVADVAPSASTAPVASSAAAAPAVVKVADVAPTASTAPVAMMSAPAVAGDGTKPAGLAAARGGVADDLKKIEGIGPALEKLCNEMGIFHFDQIANWGAAEVAWMDGNLKGFRGRVTRDKWVAQAKLIGLVGMDEFLRRAKTNDY